MDIGFGIVACAGVLIFNRTVNKQSTRRRTGKRDRKMKIWKDDFGEKRGVFGTRESHKARISRQICFSSKCRLLPRNGIVTTQKLFL